MATWTRKDADFTISAAAKRRKSEHAVVLGATRDAMGSDMHVSLLTRVNPEESLDHSIVVNWGIAGSKSQASLSSTANGFDAKTATPWPGARPNLTSICGGF
ncbi:MAG: hypothetical protein HZB13_18240 [Acidobacteria bacterium]|nr:hypothetical protein [Acidobacteriota bacterium]